MFFSDVKSGIIKVELREDNLIVSCDDNKKLSGINRMLSSLTRSAPLDGGKPLNYILTFNSDEKQIVIGGNLLDAMTALSKIEVIDVESYKVILGQFQADVEIIIQNTMRSLDRTEVYPPRATSG